MMQKFTIKLWSAAAGTAAVAAISGAAIAAEAPTVADPTDFVYPTGFDKALSLLLAGEGGENGIGVHKVWPTLSVPALNTEQINKAVSGNSLVIPYHYTHQYGENGKVGGYNIRYDQVDVNLCPKTEIPGDGYLLYEGVCSAQVEEPITGTWEAKDHELCVKMKWGGSTQLDGCYTMFFIMDSVAFVKPDGTVSGKAHALKKGAVRDM